MPVIREKKNFSIGPVGVTRASEAGRITGQAITQSANQMGEIFFERAAKQAEEFGLKEGASVDREQVIAINPQTGEPEAYEPPQGLGSIGADAYQRVVMTRFQRSIEDEIRNKASELSLRFEENPNGVALYTEAMSDYISSMTDVAQDEFRGYIGDVGTTYLNATRTSMAAAQVRRERAAARRAQTAAINEGLENLHNAFAQNGTAALSSNEGEPTLGDVINEGVSVAINDGAEAQLFNPEEAAGYTADQSVAAITGLVAFHARQEGADPEQLALMRAAIGMGSPAAIPAEFTGVADLYRNIATNREALGKIDTFSNRILTDSIGYNTILQSQESERIATETALRIGDMGQTLLAEIQAADDFAFETDSSSAVADRALINFRVQNGVIQGHTENGDEQLRQFAVARQTALIQGTARGLYARALYGVTVEQTLQMQEAIDSRRFDNAPTLTSRSVIRALDNIQAETGIPVLANFEAEIDSHRGDSAKAVEMRLEREAISNAGEIDIASIRSSEDPQAELERVLNEIDGIENLPIDRANALRSGASYNTARGLVDILFSDSSLTESQLDQVSTGVRGGTVPEGVFSDQQISLLQRINEYSEASGDPSGIQSMVGDFVTSRKDHIEARAAENEIFQLESQIVNGGGNGNLAEHRQIADQLVLEGTGIPSIPPRAYSSPQFLNSEEGQLILNRAAQMNVLPESLYTAFTQFGNGQFNGEDIGAFMDVIRNFSTVNNRGQVIANPAFRALPSDVQVVLTYFSDVAQTLGTENQNDLMQAYVQYQDYEDNERTRNDLNEKLGMPLADYVYTIGEGRWFASGVGEAPLSVANNLMAEALRLNALNLSESEINDRLTQQLDRTYPDSRGVVINSSGGTRSVHALEVTENIENGYETLFKQFVVDQVSLHNPSLTNIMLGNVAGDMTNPYAPGLFDTNQIFLRPLPQSAGGDVSYTVHLRTEDGFNEELTRIYSESGPMNPDGITYRAPIVVSNRDALFLQQRQSAIMSEERENIAAGVEARARFEGRRGPIGGFTPALERAFGIETDQQIIDRIQTEGIPSFGSPADAEIEQTEVAPPSRRAVATVGDTAFERALMKLGRYLN